MRHFVAFASGQSPDQKRFSTDKKISSALADRYFANQAVFYLLPWIGLTAGVIYLARYFDLSQVKEVDSWIINSFDLALTFPVALGWWLSQLAIEMISISTPKEHVSSESTSIDRGEMSKPTIQTSRELAKTANNIFRKSGQKVPPIYWGDLPIRDHVACEHFLIHGEIGSGKSIILKNLLSQAIQRRKSNPEIRIFVDDPKRDMVPCLIDMGVSDYTIINPFDSRSYVWNIYEDLSDTRQIDTFVTMMFPEEKSTDSFWPNNARQALTSIITYFVLKRVEWDFRDLVLAFRYPTYCRQMAMQTGIGRGIIETLQEKQLASVFSDVLAKLGNFRTIAIASHEIRKQHPERTFSVSAWMKRENDLPLLVFSRDPYAKAAMDKLCSLFFYFVSLEVHFQDELKYPKTWLFMDEALQLAHMPEISHLLDLGRSKGVTLCLSTQSANDYQKRADKYKNTSPSVVTRIPNKALLKVTGKDADFSSEQFGDVYKEAEQRGQSWGDRYSESRTVSEQQAKAVGPHIFRELRKADPDIGVPHYAISDTAICGGAWSANLPFNQWPPDSRVEKFEQLKLPIELEEWDVRDLERLHLVNEGPSDIGGGPDDYIPDY